MSKNNKATLVPKLRFPEFLNIEYWDYNNLGKISTILRGGSPRPIDNYITSEARGLNWLKIGDVNKESKYISHTSDKVIKEALSKTRQVNPGDLIMSNSMSFGRPYILRIKTCIHDGWIAITEIKNSVITDYLYYYVLSNGSQQYFLNSAAGGGIKNLNAEIIKALPVAFPQKEEQQKIVYCLSSLDELIAAEDKKLEELKSHKKGLMQKLFPAEGKTVPELRFEGYTNAWEKRELGEIFNTIRNAFVGTATPYYVENGGHFYLESNNVKNGEINRNKEVFINQEFYMRQKDKWLYEGDLVMVQSGSCWSCRCNSKGA